MMQAALPPAPADADNAAPLHARAGAAIAAAPDLSAADGILAEPRPDVASPAVADLLARHAELLETIRRAADLPACRFERDWTRPSIDMLLPEVQACRGEARLLALATRREAADGRHAVALADVVRIGRIGRQVGAEPLLISHLVGVALDAVALEVLTEILPRLGPGDAALLDAPGLRDLVSSAPTLARALTGEEAFGLSTFADFSDGRGGIRELGNLWSNPNVAMLPSGESGRLLAEPISAVWRVFFLPSDIAGYRRRFKRYRQRVSIAADQSQSWPEVKKWAAETEAELRESGPDGALSRLLTPAIESVLRSQTIALARHRAAEVLLAATRERLAGGALPAPIDALVPARLPVVPRDPFSKEGPMRSRVDGEAMTVWSVGPDGEDDGGPQRNGEERDPENDDVGLRMGDAPAPRAEATPAGAAP